MEYFNQMIHIFTVMFSCISRQLNKFSFRLLHLNGKALQNFDIYMHLKKKTRTCGLTYAGFLEIEKLVRKSTACALVYALSSAARQ